MTSKPILLGLIASVLHVWLNVLKVFVTSVFNTAVTVDLTLGTHKFLDFSSTIRNARRERWCLDKY